VPLGKYLTTNNVFLAKLNKGSSQFPQKDNIFSVITLIIMFVFSRKIQRTDAKINIIFGLKKCFLPILK